MFFDRKKPFKSARRPAARVGQASGKGHWYEGQWYPASAGMSSSRRGPAPGRSRQAYPTGRSNGGRSRGARGSDYGGEGNGNGGFGPPRIGYRF